LAKDGRQRILIVDDEERVRDILLHYLQNGELDCEASHDALDAWHKLRNRHYSLVISDIVMPGMSGIELLSLAKETNPEIAFIMVTGFMDIHVAVDSLRIGASDFITKPFSMHSVKRAVTGALEGRRIQIENRCRQERLEKEVQERTFALNKTLSDVEESYQATLETLVAALDAREHETSSHSHRVREYTLMLARTLGLQDDLLLHLGRGALLHDVGKIGVRDSILLKPGKLTDSEWVEMRKHPQIGYDILQNIEFLAPAAEMVLCHQERYDGSGYPNGLAGAGIPIGARIFAVVDTLDAMTSTRPYRKALSFETAVTEIRDQSGTQFDPFIVDAFFSMVPAIRSTVHTTPAQTFVKCNQTDPLRAAPGSSR